MLFDLNMICFIIPMQYNRKYAINSSFLYFRYELLNEDVFLLDYAFELLDLLGLRVNG